LNGFPAKPTLLPVAVPAPATGEVVASLERPKIFNQMCILPVRPTLEVNPRLR
jgi:hypothetical protein